MKRFWTGFKRFWRDEEVPRWMGFSLVLLYLVGLGAAAWTAVSDTRERCREVLRERLGASVTLLGETLASVDSPDDATRHRILRRFARDHDCSQLRVVDRDGLVLASLRSQEIGKPNPFDPQIGDLFPRQAEILTLHRAGSARLAGGETGTECLFRVPVERSATGTVTVAEGVLSLGEPQGISLTGQAGPLGVILAAAAALLMLYHGMRKHFRVFYQISGSAEEQAVDTGALAEQLDTLRVADTCGAVAQTWNSLIDLVEELRDQARRSVASDELCRVLERSTGGQLADALNALPDAFLYITNGDTVQYANAMAARLLGWKREDGATAPLGEAGQGPFNTCLLRELNAARRPDGTFEARTQIVEVPGTGSLADHYRLRVLPLRRAALGRSGECILVASDVSQQVRADRAREDFVSQVTHELRTPLTNIRAYAETLSSGMFDDPSVITECYNVITRETRRLSRLIEDILSISQMEAGSIQLVEDDVDVRTLVSDAVRDVRGLADEKNIDLQMKLPAKLGKLHGDRDKLAVVLNNILGNALKYTPSGGSVHVGCVMNEAELQITVKDTGIGIGPEDQERIFEKFQRADDPEVQNETGTGIGLTTAREIVRRHNGDIRVLSAKGQGSTFVVTIPVSADRQQVVAVAGGAQE